MSTVLSKEELAKQLTTIEGWELVEGKLHTQIEFENFKEAFSMMTRIAFEAEALNHHPEWINVYNQLDISLSTHDEGGITQKDIDLAKQINALIGW